MAKPPKNQQDAVPALSYVGGFFDEARWESYRRLGQHVGHRVLTKEPFDHFAMTASNGVSQEC